MISIYYIIQKHIGATSFFLPLSGYHDEYWRNVLLRNISITQCLYYDYMFKLSLKYGVSISNRPRIKKFIFYKFWLLDEMLNNPFITLDVKAEILHIFCKVQRTYYALSKFAHLYKYKKATVKIAHDLCLNPIDETHTNVITIFQEGSNYLFKLGDLINMINAALTNSTYFFPSPLICKNPYNNIPFNIPILYTIYFYVKASTFIMPILLHNYFLAEFNISTFKYHNDTLIRNMNIKNHAFNSPPNALYKDVIAMLKEYKKKQPIHKDFPHDNLVNIMRPYLHLYYLSNMSKHYEMREDAHLKLRHKLIQLFNYNRLFGRKFIHICKRMITTTPQTTITYNDTHPNFNDGDELMAESYINNAMYLDSSSEEEDLRS